MDDLILKYIYLGIYRYIQLGNSRRLAIFYHLLQIIHLMFHELFTLFLFLKFQHILFIFLMYQITLGLLGQIKYIIRIIMIELCYFASENMGLLLIRIAFFTGNIIFIIPPSSQLLRFFSNSSYIPRLKHAVGSFSKSQILFIVYVLSMQFL